MVDMKEFVRVILRFDEGGQILGGRFQPINDIFEYFFGQIKKKGAKLVFFWRVGGGINHYRTHVEVFDRIRNHRSLKEFLLNKRRQFEKDPNAMNPDERLCFNLTQISKIYGDIFVTSQLDEGAILSYARQNRNDVLSLITRNTDYLMFDDDFEFWSLSNIQIFEFKILKFDRDNLRKKLRLSCLQMQLLNAISHLNPEDKQRICGNYDIFGGLTPYVRRQKSSSSGYDVSQLTGDFTEAQRERISNQLKRTFETNICTGSLSDDTIEIVSEWAKTDANFDSVAQVYRNNIYFAYKLMNETATVHKDLLFIDFDELDSAQYVDLVTDIILKLCGIIFKDVRGRPEFRSITITKDDKVLSRTQKLKIIYPPGQCNLPSNYKYFITEYLTKKSYFNYFLKKMFRFISKSQTFDLRRE